MGQSFLINWCREKSVQLEMGSTLAAISSRAPEMLRFMSNSLNSRVPVVFVFFFPNHKQCNTIINEGEISGEAQTDHMNACRYVLWINLTTFHF